MTLWLVIYFKTPIEAMAVARLIKFAVMLPIEGLLVYYGKKMLVDKIDRIGRPRPSNAPDKHSVS